MTTQYKVWLEIEEIDESRDHFETVDTPGGSVATFGNYQEACEFVEHASALLNSDTEPLVPMNPAEIREPSSSEGLYKLLLLHGRKDPNQDMEEWGFSAAPILGVKWMHFTYFSTITIGFESVAVTEAARELTGWSLWDTCILEVSKHDDMIRTADCFYGDFELIADTA